MKRQQDRDSPIKSKRSRSSLPRYDDSPRDRGSSDRRDRRRVNKSPGDQRRGRTTTRDSSLERGMQMGRSGGSMSLSRDIYDDYSRDMKPERGDPYSYKILCVSSIHHKVSDAAVRDAVYREFSRFGDISVKVCHDGNARFAYIYFRTYEDAREARHAKSRLILFDKPVHVDPILDRDLVGRRNRSMSPDYGSHGPMRSVSPAHSTGSAGGMGRRSGGGRRNNFERNPGPPVFGPPPPYREPPMRHDMQHEFQPPPHRRDEIKKEKFPNYLHHVPPEEDDKATRTLFVGNLEVAIPETELRRIFERYGVVEDIDVKRPLPGQGNAYAFIKFLNLDMAHRAKVEMSGQYIGKFQCKIGYGKATPTTRIWVGGLGPWTSLSHLEREFDRFGAIRKIDFVKGDNHAYIQYDSIDAAQAACQEMRGFPLGGLDKRLRVDFADPGPYSYFDPTRPDFRGNTEEQFELSGHGVHDLPPPEEFFGGPEWLQSQGFPPESPYDPDFDRPPRNLGREPWPPEMDDRRGDYRGWSRERHGWWDQHGRGNRESGNDRRKRPFTSEEASLPDGAPPPTGPDSVPFKNPRISHTPEPGECERTPINKDTLSPRRSKSDTGRISKDCDPSNGDFSDSRERKEREPGEVNNTCEMGRTRGNDDKDSSESGKKLLSDSLVKEGIVAIANSVTNIQDLAKCCPVAWHGGLVLKNSAFPSRMHVCSGDPSLVDSLMKVSSVDVPVLRINQRLRLDQPKLEDVTRRISNAGNHGHCMLLAMPGSVSHTDDQSGAVQQRPLRNLVSYLKQKEAAGVVALQAASNKKDGKDLNGVLYAFPPCEFTLELLRRIVPNLTGESSKEDHLVVVVVKGAT
ncbi:putative RNA-binding protein 15 [Limulus polyphemus]|uniref:RNA-binding protein 15 n=1 Tax=Limulus polyphemus TaxID=6850 RepID=A0ABM1S3Q4_LIMPO|nr:putative RNA-binding protein 15 [Limulus polyphemus]